MTDWAMSPVGPSRHFFRPRNHATLLQQSGHAVMRAIKSTIIDLRRW